MTAVVLVQQGGGQKIRNHLLGFWGFEDEAALSMWQVLHFLSRLLLKVLEDNEIGGFFSAKTTKKRFISASLIICFLCVSCCRRGKAMERL